MSDASLVILIVAFFLTSLVGVVTGSNSLITVPVMFQVGIDEKVAVATNMFGLVFMAIGGAIAFIRKGHVEKKGLPPLIALTIVGSAIGALIVGRISGSAIKTIVTVAMFSIVIFTLIGSRKKNSDASEHSRFQALGMVLAFLLAIYGGLYSGGYVTVLTATCVAFLGMSYSGAIAATKVINVFSSGIAALVFMYQGLVDYRLGVILGLTMFIAAYIGAHVATRMNEVWLRRIFLATVLVLAVKTAADLLLD
jgi:uncharacterized membrane protein YfcA